jgi:hypothetical protein
LSVANSAQTRITSSYMVCKNPNKSANTSSSGTVYAGFRGSLRVISYPSRVIAYSAIAAAEDVSVRATAGADEHRDCSPVPLSPAGTETSGADQTEVAIGLVVAVIRALSVTLALHVLLAVGIA